MLITEIYVFGINDDISEMIQDVHSHNGRLIKIICSLSNGATANDFEWPSRSSPISGLLNAIYRTVMYHLTIFQLTWPVAWSLYDDWVEILSITVWLCESKKLCYSRRPRDAPCQSKSDYMLAFVGINCTTIQIMEIESYSRPINYVRPAHMRRLS